MAYQLFERRLRIELQKVPGGDNEYVPGKEDHNFIAWEFPMHISVEITKSLSLTKNQAKIVIWNLSKKSKKYLQAPNGVIRILAGYGENLQLLFVGRVLDADHTHEAPDWKTEIIAGGVMGYTLEKSKQGDIPVYVNVKLVPVSISVKAGETWGTLFTALTKSVALGLQCDRDLMNRRMENDFNFVCTAIDAWNKVIKILGNEYYFFNQNNQIIIVGYTELENNIEISGKFKLAYVNKGTGLLNVTDVTKSISTEVKQLLEKQNFTRRMVKCKTLFLPLIDVNTGVVIESTQLLDISESNKMHAVVEDCEWKLSNYEQNFYIEFYAVQQKEKKGGDI